MLQELDDKIKAFSRAFDEIGKQMVAKIAPAIQAQARAMEGPQQ